MLKKSYLCLPTIKTLVVCSLSVSLLFLFGCQDKKPPARPIPTVETVVIKESNIPYVKQYIGITQSISSVDIRARVKGYLEKMNFTEGKPVKKNQNLFIIETKPLAKRS